MTDIVERLRKLAERERPYGSLPDTLDEAAGEIGKLRAQVKTVTLDCLAADGQAADLMADNEKLRAALQAFADAMNILSSRPGITMTKVANVLNEVGAKARAALEVSK